MDEASFLAQWLGMPRSSMFSRGCLARAALWSACVWLLSVLWVAPSPAAARLLAQASSSPRAEPREAPAEPGAPAPSQGQSEPGRVEAPPAAPGSAPRPSAAAPGARVLVARIEGMIDLGLGPFVERVLRQAEERPGSSVVLDIDTFGGRVDAAVAIRDHLLESSVQTVAFVNQRAISAGALIALATETVAMTRGATMGAATPVQLGQPGEAAQPVEEKTVSYVRKEFRATADARDRPGLIAEAMVDADVEIEGLIEKGKLLTLTTGDALEHGVADLEAEDLPDLLAALGWGGREVEYVELNWAERSVRFLTHPVLASLLMTLGMLGLIIELRTPGLGWPGLVGVLSLAAFFWGHALVQLVGWEQLLLVAAGLALLALEVFVIPGFGLAGVAGIVALVLGLGTSLVGEGATLEAIVGALSRVALSAVLAVALGLLAMRFLPRLPFSRQLVLGAALDVGGGRAVASSGRAAAPASVGLQGTTLTPLRPAGIASFGGRRVDVVSEGEYIDSGQEVTVMSVEGSRVVVRRRAGQSPEGSAA